MATITDELAEYLLIEIDSLHETLQQPNIRSMALTVVTSSEYVAILERLERARAEIKAAIRSSVQSQS